MESEKNTNRKTARVTPSKVVGKAEEIIPFAWRNPLTVSELKKTSKKLRILTEEEAERVSKMLMPV